MAEFLTETCMLTAHCYHAATIQTSRGSEGEEQALSRCLPYVCCHSLFTPDHPVTCVASV